MANNKSKIDRIHTLLPGHLHSKTNTNWKALVDAIGEADQGTADLVSEVRKQFFVKTSSRPYIDKLAANNMISRPRLVGMSDASFRDYIPVLSYQPKQVKIIIDQLLDIFFFKESTTAFLMSSRFEPFGLVDKWELEYNVDGQNVERILFNAADFTDITNATADEIVAALNRQSKFSYATNYYDSITKKHFIRIFTKTVGSKGSLQLVGGRANIPLQFNGFIQNAGTGANTQWTVTKVGDLTTFQHTGGANPGINQLQVGDVLISNLPGNQGSFTIVNVDLSNNLIQFRNLFSTPGVIGQLSANDTKYIRPDKYTVWKVPRRAITWETVTGEITVEMPTTPPVVQRTLKGSFHVNGALSTMTNRDSDTSLTVTNAGGFPVAGSFIIEPVTAITSRILTPDINEVITTTSNGRLIYEVQRYEYASRVAASTIGNSTTGSDQITVTSIAGITLGMTIFMEGFREDAVVTDITGLTITSSVKSTAGAAGVPVQFGGNTLFGITPNLPELGTLNELTLTALSRSSNVVTATTASTHDYIVGDSIIISGSSGINILSTTGDTNSSNLLTNLASVAGIAPGQLIFGAGIPANTKVQSVVSPTSVMMTLSATATATGVSIMFNEDTNGTFEIQSVTSNQFTYNHNGTNGSATTPGVARVERMAISNSNSKIIITDAQLASNTRIKGAYLWDVSAPYVLSSNTATISDEIEAGTIVRLINISTNTIPSQSGFLIFDYGRNTQEGPVRYLYKPADGVIAIDPSYVFQQSHSAGSAVVAISHKGPHVMDTHASEYGPYITDPSEAREILENLIKSVKSAGIFVNFLIRFPEQLYGTLDVYNSGTLP